MIRSGRSLCFRMFILKKKHVFKDRESKEKGVDFGWKRGKQDWSLEYL